ncbi:hypothetical protein Abu_1874 [Aliarcobacter butzleri RM4018]|uniref:Uncharacterized protein n=1 Tax=Aliarcobacter butzleri (strain RM4018) TaxID=367737 RepID=A8EVY7_ALIB4|nr:hypothetical protein [Aliarcobacter butzleri]ABV68110.1 hypothetical protein Abu_1874 [Aliarcobacter butzleri RM4018]GGT83631.1 hypothetical protein GCM10007985_20240 [Aliarcobacter butzleri]SNV32162.1 Uncharacterised protein [Aliarcobacter butzleri]
MFIGISKNLGNGFRIGIGTKINLDNNNKKNEKDKKEQEFQEFLNSMNTKTLDSVKKFVETNGYNFEEISKYEIDLDDLFIGSKKYEEFMKIVLDINKIAMRTLEIKDYGVVAKRKISDSVYNLVDFVEDYNKNFNTYLEQGLATKSIEIDYTQYKRVEIKKEKNISEISMVYKIFIYIGVIFMPYIFAWFTLKKGFSKTSRIISFVWLVLLLIGFINSPKNDQNTNTTNTTQEVNKNIK